MRISNFSPSFSHGWIRKAISYLIAFFIFVLILINRSPNPLRPLSMNVRFGFTLAIPLIFIVLYLSFRIRGWVGDLISLTATLALFALALAGMWASGHTQSTVLSGLIPLTDAQNYYVDALRLLAGRNVLEFSAARPLFAGFLATLLALTSRNLMAAIAILTAINGLACYFAAKEIQSTHGSLAATFLLIFLFLYYRYRTISTVMSENLGLPLGILGVVLIWRSITKRSYQLMLMGIFISTLALNARPGALFTLPILLLWGSWYFKENNKQFSWRFFILGAGTIVVGFALNLLMVRLIGVSSSVPFSQFSYALYGLASGGNNWSYLFQVHPELLGLSEPERTQTIYKLIFELMRSHPTSLFQGILYNWSVLFSNSGYNLFSYISGENYYVNIAIHWGLYLLCILALINISDPYTSFVSATSIGVLASVPFVPPADAYGMRLYAASIIILGLLPAMGLVFALKKIGINLEHQPTAMDKDSQITIWYVATLTLLLFAGPLVVRGINYIPNNSTITCPPSTDSIVVRLDPGSSIQLIRQKDFALDWMPIFHQGTFKLNAHGLPDNYFTEWLGTIAPPKTMFYTLDYQSNQAALVIIPTTLLPHYGMTVQMCGTWESDPALKPYSIFLSNDVKIISNRN